MFRMNESCHQNATCDGCSRGTHAIKEGLLVQAKMYGKHNYEQKFYSINDMMQHHSQGKICFSFGRRKGLGEGKGEARGFFILFILMFLLCSNQVPIQFLICSHQGSNVFPVCSPYVPQIFNVFLKMFPIVPHFIPEPLNPKLNSHKLYGWAKGKNSYNIILRQQSSI